MLPVRPIESLDIWGIREKVRESLRTTIRITVSGILAQAKGETKRRGMLPERSYHIEETEGLDEYIVIYQEKHINRVKE